MILGTVCARGGSRGIPDKNVRPLLGKPLIAWSIEHAITTAEIDRVVVSTDSESIAEAARAAGAEVPFLRPEALAGAQTGKFDVWKHVVEACSAHYGEEYEALVDLDCTSPLREPDDVSRAIEQFRQGRDRGVDAVFSICDARKNPYFNLVEPDREGALRMSKQRATTVVRRQDAPTVYEHVASIYVLDPNYVRCATHLLDGHTEGYDIGAAKSLDIDSELDFEMIEFLMRRRS